MYKLLGVCARSWKSIRMASSKVARRDLLANKVALVTASTEGIGLAIARRLAQDGAHVVISSRKQQNVDRAVAALQREGLSVTGTVCHVGKAEDRERLVAMAVKLHGGIDILVSNAAVNPFFGNLMDVPEEVWDKKWLNSDCDLHSSLQPVSFVDGRGERGDDKRSPADTKARQARGLCRHCVFPVLRRCQLHHWGNSGSGWRGSIPPLSTWREPARTEIGLQRLVQFLHSWTGLSHLCLTYCSPYTLPPPLPQINSAL
ncbi:dehydrogenase/reductase SDR family member 4-like 2 isoform X2 [Phyllostomus hastatus]|uniref:dehydrogenase/reductase SDR family member 4-like 2 isoform X2 n=1 Tax=Phyllostomus hastatus TaxID=9423 RepID=UPI001E68150E|nr:dehydrogenase/reductase SDR family member 4-like 2 isoform X2 [Phyllostomus hastatus]